MKTSGLCSGLREYREVWQTSKSIQRRLGKGLGPSADGEMPGPQDRWLTKGGPCPAAAAAPGNVLAVQALRSPPRQTESEAQKVGCSRLCCSKLSDDSGMLTFKNRWVCINKLHCPKRRAEICGRPSCTHSTHSRSRSRMSRMAKHRCGWGSPVVGSFD